MGALNLASATTAGSGGSAWSHATPVILAILGSSVLAGLVSTALGNLRAAATIRRDRYAEAVRALVAWNEYPYRIRRRVDDNAATLDKLASMGHDLQERLGSNRAWIAGESDAVRLVYDACINELSATVGPACKQAWQSPPIRTAAEMNLAGFGGGSTADVLSRMECAVPYRFGWRRALPAKSVRRRFQRRGCLPISTPEGGE